MKKLNQYLAVMLLSTLSLTTYAKPATDASVERVLELSDIKATLARTQIEMRPIYDQQAEEIIKNVFQVQSLNPEQQKAAKEISTVIYSFSNKLISDPKFVQMLKNVYKQTFTEEEILANIQFLETPLGQSINKKTSKMMSEIMQQSMTMSAEMMQDSSTQNSINQQIKQILKPLFEQTKTAP